MTYCHLTYFLVTDLRWSQIVTISQGAYGKLLCWLTNYGRQAVKFDKIVPNLTCDNFFFGHKIVL